MQHCKYLSRFSIRDVIHFTGHVATMQFPPAPQFGDQRVRCFSSRRVPPRLSHQPHSRQPPLSHAQGTQRTTRDAHTSPTTTQDHLLYLALREAGMQRCFEPSYPTREDIALVHDAAYVDAFCSGSLPPAAMRAIGLPWSPQLVQRTIIGVGSAILAARLALQFGVACMTNGGTHHAHSDRGAGARN